MKILKPNNPDANPVESHLEQVHAHPKFSWLSTDLAPYTCTIVTMIGCLAEAVELMDCGFQTELPARRSINTTTTTTITMGREVDEA
eukprot:scaffold157012_cov16-Tisochrysis_lutea.AAC.1